MSKVLINPPPSDMKCQRCGKHVDELKPFGKEGDPLNGNFEGAKLVKTYRAMMEDNNPELEKILSEYHYDDDTKIDNMDELISKYGKELVDSAFFYGQLTSTVGASWECRDCIII